MAKRKYGGPNLRGRAVMVAHNGGWVQGIVVTHIRNDYWCVQVPGRRKLAWGRSVPVRLTIHAGNLYELDMTPLRPTEPPA